MKPLAFAVACSICAGHSRRLFTVFFVTFSVGAAFNPSAGSVHSSEGKLTYAGVHPVTGLCNPARAPSRRLAEPLMTEVLELEHAPRTKQAWVAQLGDKAHGTEIGADYYDFFTSLATSPEFVSEVWARKPRLFSEVTGVANSFNFGDLQEAVDSDFLDASRGDANRGGWQMETVAEPRGSSFEDAKIRYIDIQEALKKGTVFLNSAASHVPRLGTVSLAALDAMWLPNCLNLYLTAKGTKKSAPPHTDKQDVFVCQSTGAKHWRVFEPPSPERKPHEDPMARGKVHDTLDLSELGEPVIDVVLKPGDVLYVPAGFPHTTDTTNTDEAGDAADEDSLHLTIGLDTHIWGLDYASIRRGALTRAKLPDTLNVNGLPAEQYWHLMKVPSSLGFLKNCKDQTHMADMASELIESARLAEPPRWKEKTDSELGDVLGATEVKAQLERHANRICQLQRDMYMDAACDILPPTPPGMPRVTMWRVKEHMEKMKAAMDEHKQWYGTTAASTAPSPPSSKKTDTGAKKVTMSGFGAAGGGAKKGAKDKSKGKAKKKKR